MYAPRAKKIHIDIDPSELHKNVRADVAIAGDLRTVLRAWLPQVQPARHDAWLTRIRSFAGGPTVRDLAGIDDPGPLQAAQVIHDIWRATEGQAIVVTDVGQHQMWAAQYYRVAEPNTWVTSGGLGTMGFALPAAIGAKLARPDREVWAIVGDGGFQMTQAELHDADAGGREDQHRDHQQRLPRHGAAVAAVLPRPPLQLDAAASPDFVKIADAHGVHGAVGVDPGRGARRDSAGARSPKARC